jgi:hypothetical protein
MVEKAHKSYGARSGLNSGFYNGVPSIHFFPSRTQNSIQISPPCDIWALQTMKRELRGKKFLSDQRSAARFREVGGAL